MDGKNEGVKGEMLAELRQRRPGHTLPRRFYGDPLFHELDLKMIWRREWLFAGHDCEIPMPGDYFTLQLGDDPIVVVRGRDGSVRAFHNTCRHRGSRICSADKGSVVRLVCSYHNWSYELDGRLLFARDMGANFDRSQHGLKAVACESVGGYVWICLAAEPPDFADFLTNTAPYLEPHDLSAAKIAAESTIVENGNWKLVWENNRECYHCASNHPELCRTFPNRPTVAGIEGVASDPIIAEHWRRCEAAGMPSRFTLSEDGQWRVARMPLVGDAVSYTMSGRAAVSRGLSDQIAEPRIGSMLLFHYPSTWNHLLGDHAVTFRVLPLGPKQTQMTTKWLVHRDAVEGVDYSVDELTAVWNATNDQDRRIVEENQRGVSSPAYEPGPYSPVHEGGVIQFVEWYCAATERALRAGQTRPQAARKRA